MGVMTGEGTTLSYSADGATWTEVAQVLSVTPPGWTRPAVSTKHLKSAIDTQRPGKIPHHGPVQFRIQVSHGEATHLALYAMADDLAEYHWRIDYFDEQGEPAGSDTILGFVTEYSPDGGEDEANHEADLTIEVSTAAPAKAAPGGGG